MSRIDITPPQVHRMGDAAGDVADGPLGKAHRAMSQGHDDAPATRLQGFMTKSSLDTALVTWETNTGYDVRKIRSVGAKLHQTANAIVRGDNHSTDEFERVPMIHVPHVHIPGR